jgi:hypothetical protein
VWHWRGRILTRFNAYPAPLRSRRLACRLHSPYPCGRAVRGYVLRPARVRSRCPSPGLTLPTSSGPRTASCRRPCPPAPCRSRSPTRAPSWWCSPTSRTCPPRECRRPASRRRRRWSSGRACSARGGRLETGGKEIRSEFSVQGVMLALSVGDHRTRDAFIAHQRLKARRRTRSRYTHVKVTTREWIRPGR